MSAAPKGDTPERDTPAPSARDHEHVGRISTQTTIFVLIAVALILYEIQWVLPPLALLRAGRHEAACGLLRRAAVWLCDRQEKGSGLAQLEDTVDTEVATLIGYLGIPPLAREMTHVFNDFEAVVRELAQRLIGSGKVSLLGAPMDATQLASTAANGLRNWFSQTAVLATLGAAIFGTMFGLILTLVLLFYFLLSGASMARGLLQLVPPRQRPLIVHIWRVLDPVLKRYFIGVLIVVAYAAAAAYIGLGLVLGIPHAVPLALLTGVLDKFVTDALKAVK